MPALPAPEILDHAVSAARAYLADRRSLVPRAHDLAVAVVALADMRDAWCKALNRRAAVEEVLLRAAAGKAPLPTREDCRALALQLGVPTANVPDA